MRVFEGVQYERMYIENGKNGRYKRTTKPIFFLFSTYTHIYIYIKPPSLFF